MSHDEEADRTADDHPEFDRLIEQSRAWLAERGETIVGSGCFGSARFSASIHTDFGPKDQDKTANQDYALAWSPYAADTGRRLRFVMALADGLTTSFRSERAAALACWIALRALVEAGPAAPPKEQARYAFNEAGLTIGRLVDDLARDPEASCPAGQFPSTWKYVLKKGVLFQTTLTLAWLDRDFLQIAMVGDGGAVWRGYHGPPGERRASDRVLAACDLDSQQVYALGPADRCVHEFDCWREEEANGPFLCAIHTDGVGRGLGTDPRALLDELERLHGLGVANPAQRFIQQAIETRPQDYADNLTLALIRGD